jgi:hypothetical protein
MERCEKPQRTGAHLRPGCIDRRFAIA